MRLFDCTTYVDSPPPGSDDPYIAVPGRGSFETAHIPGADFLDVQREFSDNTTRLRFMMPSLKQLEVAFGRHGIGADSRVVLQTAHHRPTEPAIYHREARPPPQMIIAEAGAR